MAGWRLSHRQDTFPPLSTPPLTQGRHGAGAEGREVELPQVTRGLARHNLGGDLVWQHEPAESIVAGIAKGVAAARELIWQ